MSPFKNMQDLETRLWSAADQMRANTGLTSQQYSRPVLGLIFLRYAEYRFTQAEEQLTKQSSRRRRGSQSMKAAIQAQGAMYVPEGALFSNLLELPEDRSLGTAINNAMRALEEENEAIKDALPKTYHQFSTDILVSLLKNFANIRFDIGSDVFGRIYEYFLTEFARAEGSKGGEFFTPSTVVRLITEIIEPYHGKVFDPACGSGGMFVQSANFVEEHLPLLKKGAAATAADELSIYGQEKTGDNVRLAKMNLAVHGLQGDIRESNSYYEDIHNCAGQFDFVMANPPFNVDAIQKERLEDDKARFPFGMPRTDNGNYIWIQLFYAALNAKGRAGFVMANSASDARGSEMEIRKQIIQSGAVDVMIAISSNFFYTVTLPCTLWFFNKGKKNTTAKDGGSAGNAGAIASDDKVLFIDARHIHRQVTRAVRDFTSEQLNFIANIVRLYRGAKLDNTYLDHHPDDGNDGKWTIKEYFPKNKYQDIPGLCKVATLKEIEEQGWSLNPGRYVGVAAGEEEHDEEFAARLEALQEELEVLNSEARELEQIISENVTKVLEAVT